MRWEGKGGTRPGQVGAGRSSHPQETLVTAPRPIVRSSGVLAAVLATGTPLTTAACSSADNSASAGSETATAAVERALAAQTESPTPSPMSPTSSPTSPPATELSETGARNALITEGAKPTVVLVHDARADDSGRAEVIRSPRAKGCPAVATANPLRGLTGDSAHLATRLKTVEGPVVLVGHFYGGAVITDPAGNPNAESLVHVAAFAPDKGETTLQPTAECPASRLTAAPDAPFPTHLILRAAHDARPGLAATGTTDRAAGPWRRGGSGRRRRYGPHGPLPPRLTRRPVPGQASSSGISRAALRYSGVGTRLLLLYSSSARRDRYPW